MTRLICVVLLGSALKVVADPYTYYGGQIDAQEKNTAIEQCEYRVLVEEQRCNSSLNKSRCIRDVHRECTEEFDDETARRAAPSDGNDPGVNR